MKVTLQSADLFEFLMDACGQTDMSGRLVKFNDLYCRMTGYDPAELTTLTYLDLTPQQWHARETEIIRSQVISRGYSDLYEKELRRKDGSIIPVELRTCLLRDREGNPAGMWAIVRDISVRKSLQEELKNRQEAFETLSNNSPNIVVRFDRNCRHLFINTAGAETVGIPAHQIVGKSVKEIGLPPPVAEEWERRIRKVLETGETIEVEDTMPTADGDRYFQYRIVPERTSEGSIITAIMVGSDITEKIRAEEALRQEKRLMEVAQQLAHLGTWGRDLLTDEVQWSAETYRIFGLPFESPLYYDDFARRVHPDDAPLVQEATMQACRNREPVTVPFRIVRPDGETRHLLRTCLVVYDEAGNPVKLEGCVQDVTELKEAELALQQANETLEKKVRERTDSLREKDHLLIQQHRFASMGEMLNNIAHQWRQPLNTLGLLVQELQQESEDLQGIDSQLLHDRMARAKELIMHMSQTIQYFSNFLTPNISTDASFDIGAGIHQALRLLERPLSRMSIVVDRDLRHCAQATGGINDFSQVLLVILANALDAFESQKIPEPRLICISSFEEEGKNIVTIADNAGGIPSAILHRVFDPYFSTKGANKGTGIGLFMARNIIEKNLMGRIMVGNRGCGTEFRLELG